MEVGSPGDVTYPVEDECEEEAKEEAPPWGVCEGVVIGEEAVDDGAEDVEDMLWYRGELEEEEEEASAYPAEDDVVTVLRPWNSNILMKISANHT